MRTCQLIDLFFDLLPAEQYIGKMFCHSLRCILRKHKVTERFQLIQWFGQGGISKARK